MYFILKENVCFQADHWEEKIKFNIFFIELSKITAPRLIVYVVFRIDEGPLTVAQEQDAKHETVIFTNYIDAHDLIDNFKTRRKYFHVDKIYVIHEFYVYWK